MIPHQPAANRRVFVMIPERENQYIEFKEESGLFHYDAVEVAAAQKSQLNFSDIADG